MGRMNRALLYPLAMVGLLAVLMGSTYAITNTFTNGTTADATEVNANFSGAKTAIDDNDSRIDALLTTDTCTTPPCDLTSGTTLGGAAIVVPGGSVGAATATTPSVNDNDTSVATTAFVQAETVAAGDVTGTIGGGLTIGANTVALGTDTTGNYAGSSSEGGAATTATALTANGANCSAGNFPLGVDASGASETCTDVVLPAEIPTMNVGTAAPTDGSDACTEGDVWLDHTANKVYYCVDSATDDWFGVALTDAP